MPFQTGDIKFFGSSGGNLGGSPTAEIPDNALHLVFPAISNEDLRSGRTEYRCIFIKNTTTDKTFFYVTVELTVPPDGTRSPVETIEIGVDPRRGTPVQQIPNSSVAPDGVVFSNRPVEVGTLSPQEVQAIWLKRTVPAGTPPGGIIKVTLKVKGFSSS